MKRIYFLAILIICTHSASAIVKTTISSSIYPSSSSTTCAPQATNIPMGTRRVYIANKTSIPEIEIALRAAENIFTNCLSYELVDLVQLNAEVYIGDINMFTESELCKVDVEYSDSIEYNSVYSFFYDLKYPIYSYLNVLVPTAITNQTTGHSNGVGMRIYINPQYSYHYDTTEPPSDKFDMITILLRALVMGCGIQSSLSPDNQDFGFVYNGKRYITAFDSQIYNDANKSFADVAVGAETMTSFLGGHAVYASGTTYATEIKLYNDWELGVNSTTISGKTLNYIDYNTYNQIEYDTAYYDLLDPSIGPGMYIRELTRYSYSMLSKIGWIKSIATGPENPLSDFYNSSIICSSHTLLPNNTYTLYLDYGDMSNAVCKLFSSDSSFVFGNMEEIDDNTRLFSYQIDSISPYIQWQRNPITKNVLGHFCATASEFFLDNYFTQEKIFDIEIPFRPNKPIVEKTETTENGIINLHLHAFANGSDSYYITWEGAQNHTTASFTKTTNVLDTIISVPATQLYDMHICGINNQGTSEPYNFTFGFSAFTLNMSIMFNSYSVVYYFSCTNNPFFDVSDIVISSVHITDVAGNTYVSTNVDPGETINIAHLPRRAYYTLTVVANGQTYNRTFFKR